MTDRIPDGNQPLPRLDNATHGNPVPGLSSQSGPLVNARSIIASPQFNISNPPDLPDASSSAVNATVFLQARRFDPSTRPVQSWGDLLSRLQGPTPDVSFDALSTFVKNEGRQWSSAYKNWESQGKRDAPPGKPDDAVFTALASHMDALLAGFWTEVDRKNLQAEREHKPHVLAAMKLSQWSFGIVLWSDSSSAPELLEATRKLVRHALMELNEQAIGNLVYNLRHAAGAYRLQVLRILDRVTHKMDVVHLQGKFIGFQMRSLSGIGCGLQYLTNEPRVLAFLQVVTVEMQAVHRQGLLIGLDAQAINNIPSGLCNMKGDPVVFAYLNVVTVEMRMVHNQRRFIGVNPGCGHAVSGLQNMTADPLALDFLDVMTVEMQAVHQQQRIIGLDGDGIGMCSLGLQNMTARPQVLAFLREETVEMRYAFKFGRVILFNTRDIANTLCAVLNLPSSPTTHDFLDAFVQHLATDTWDSSDIESWSLFMANVLNSLRNHADAPATPVIVDLLDVRMRQAVNHALPRHASVTQQIYALYKMSGKRVVFPSNHRGEIHDLQNIKITTRQYMRLDFHNCSRTLTPRLQLDMLGPDNDDVMGLILLVYGKGKSNTVKLGAMRELTRQTLEREDMRRLTVGTYHEGHVWVYKPLNDEVLAKVLHGQAVAVPGSPGGYVAVGGLSADIVCSESGKVFPYSPNKTQNDIYRAGIEIHDPRIGFVRGDVTMFPDGWTDRDIEKAITHAWVNALLHTSCTAFPDGTRIWTGESAPGGFKIDITTDGWPPRIIMAQPRLGP